jgi:hypothetical protein
VKNLVWVEGRLAWPLVAAVVFVAVSLIGVDMAWRFWVLPIERLLLYAVLADGTLAALIVVLYRLFLRGDRVPH